MKILINLLRLTLFLLVLLPFVNGTPALAQDRGCQIGDKIYCSNPGQVIGRVCKGSCGCEYSVTYCGDINCMLNRGERNCSLAPAGCNKPCGNKAITPGSEFLDVFGTVRAPNALSGLGEGEEGLNNFIGKAIQLIFIIAAIGFVFMVLISAMQMIFSGGDKEAIGKARGRLTWAIIGIVILSLAFVIFRLIGTIVQIDLLNPNP